MIYELKIGVKERENEIAVEALPLKIITHSFIKEEVTENEIFVVTEAFKGQIERYIRLMVKK